jgi:tRNA (adenine57-N1/adenine58-N1)-methyltransferase
VSNLESFLGKIPPWVDLRLGDVRDVAGSGETFDRAVLDLPEPWSVLPEVAGALHPGALLCTYLPTTNQVQQAVLALGAGGFEEITTFEVMLRPWHVTERSVRPDHRMVAHTGFVTIGRRGSGDRDSIEEPRNPNTS